MSDSTNVEYLTSGQVARLLTVSKGTVLRAVKDGALRAAYTMPGGGLRFLPPEVERYAQRLHRAPRLCAGTATATRTLPDADHTAQEVDSGDPNSAQAASPAGTVVDAAGTRQPTPSTHEQDPPLIAGATARADAVSNMLAFLAESLRVGATCLACVEEGRWQIDRVYDRVGMGLRVGTSLPLSPVLSRALADGLLTSLIVDDIQADARFADTASAPWSIGALTAVPLTWKAGRLYGALCTLHPSARPVPREEMTLLQLAGRIIMQVVEATAQLDTAREAAQARRAGTCNPNR